ncbi:MAG: O-antigen ligase family protein [Pseudomarimonas sp.]
MPATLIPPPRWQAAPIAFALFVLCHAHVVIAPLALPLLLIGFAWAGWRGEIDFARRFDRVDVASLGFAAIWLLCCITAIDSTRAFELSVPVAVALFSAVVLRRTSDLGHCADVLLLALALLATWLAGSALFASLIEHRSPEALVIAIRSPWLVVPNDLAWAACLWPLWKARWWHGNSLSRSLLIAVIVLHVFALITLQSRLGLVLMALVVTLELAGAWSTRARSTVFALAALGLALGGLLLFDKGITSVLARLQLWQAAWNLFLAHPWLGVGPHGFVLAYPEVTAATALIDPRLTPWPHSLPLELLAEGGIFLALGTCLLLFSARATIGTAVRGSVLAPFLLLCLVEASTLRLWLWVLLVLFLVSSGARSKSNLR